VTESARFTVSTRSRTVLHNLIREGTDTMLATKLSRVSRFAQARELAIKATHDVTQMHLTVISGARTYAAVEGNTIMLCWPFITSGRRFDNAGSCRTTVLAH